MRFVVTEVKTIAFKGIEITDVIVQIHILSGIPTFTIVGLPDKAVAKPKERIPSALANLGVRLPAKKYR